MIGLLSLLLAIITVVAFFAQVSLGTCLLVGGARLVIDFLAMAQGVLKLPAPLVAYIIGALAVDPWYLGVVVGGAFANLLEIPWLLNLLRKPSERSRNSGGYRP